MIYVGVQVRGKEMSSSWPYGEVIHNTIETFSSSCFLGVL